MGCILRRQLYQIEKDKVNIWDTLLEHPKDRYSLSNKIVKSLYFTMPLVWIPLRDAIYRSDGHRRGSLFHLGVETCRRPCVSIFQWWMAIILFQTHNLSFSLLACSAMWVRVNICPLLFICSVLNHWNQLHTLQVYTVGYTLHRTQSNLLFFIHLWLLRVFKCNHTLS